MGKDPDRQMSIPELLEARAKIQEQLLNTAYPHYRSPDNRSVNAELTAILAEIEAELAEQGYKAPENPDGN